MHDVHTGFCDRGQLRQGLRDETAGHRHPVDLGRRLQLNHRVSPSAGTGVSTPILVPGPAAVAGPSGSVAAVRVPVTSGSVAAGAADRPSSVASCFAHSQQSLFESRVRGMGNIVAAFALGMTFALSVISVADLLREGDREWILWLCVFAPLAVLGLIAQLIDYRRKRRERAAADSFPDA